MSLRVQQSNLCPGFSKSLLNDGGHRHIRRRGRCGGYLGQQMGGGGLTGFRQMHLIAGPGGVPLVPKTRLRIIRRLDQLCGRGAVVRRAPLYLPSLFIILLHPDLPQHFHGGQRPDAHRRGRSPQAC